MEKIRNVSLTTLLKASVDFSKYLLISDQSVDNTNLHHSVMVVM